MMPGLNALAKRAVYVFGERHQLVKATEELSELAAAICRYLNTNDPDSLLEELVDVEIMLEQIRVAFDIRDRMVERAASDPSPFHAMMARKMNRLTLLLDDRERQMELEP